MQVPTIIDEAEKALINLTVAAQKGCRQIESRDAANEFNKVMVAISRLHSLMNLCININNEGR